MKSSVTINNKVTTKNNKVTARIEFYFKGEKFTPSAVLDIDKLLEKTDKLPVIHDLLARENGIDSYSYHYEIMLLENIKYDNPQGIIRDYIANGVLDIKAFESRWKELKVLTILQAIAFTHLNVEDLEQQQELKNALFEAYQLGENSH
jgi:hypothetical protein